MTLSAFLAAYLVHLVAAASPGPAILMAARIGMTEGLRTAVFLAFGLGLGALVWALAALFGLALVFQIAPALLWGFKIAGGLFLMWIALQMWRHASDPLPDAALARARSPWSALKLGVLTQLSNPKPAVFFGAVFIGTVPADASAVAIIALLVAIFANEVLCNVLVARLFSYARIRAVYIRLKSSIDRGFGGILALLGLKIAAT